jgi:hypothetical protein
MTYFFELFGCIVALCLVIALGVGLRPPGRPKDSQSGG